MKMIRQLFTDVHQLFLTWYRCVLRHWYPINQIQFAQLCLGHVARSKWSRILRLLELGWLAIIQFEIVFHCVRDLLQHPEGFRLVRCGACITRKIADFMVVRVCFEWRSVSLVMKRQSKMLSCNVHGKRNG